MKERKRRVPKKIKKLIMCTGFLDQIFLIMVLCLGRDLRFFKVSWFFSKSINKL